MREVAARHRVVDPLGHRADDLQLDVAGGLAGATGGERLTGHLVPAHPEMLARHRRPQGLRSAHSASCQPTSDAGRMLVRVEPVARLRGEVDAADERDAVVDHDRLLVVAVHRPLLRSRARTGSSCRAVKPVAHRRARRRRDGRKSGSGAPGPDEHAHVDPLGQLGEEVPKDERVAARRARARTSG